MSLIRNEGGKKVALFFFLTRKKNASNEEIIYYSGRCSEDIVRCLTGRGDWGVGATWYGAGASPARSVEGS